MAIWKQNWYLAQTLWHSIKGFGVLYATPLVICVVFAQISDRAIVVYGLILPYLLLGFAIAEGIEMATFYMVGRHQQINMTWCWLGHGLLALGYFSGGYLYHPPGTTAYDTALIARPLMGMAALSIAAAGCVGILRARSEFRRIYRMSLCFLCVTIGTAIWAALQGRLNATMWSHAVAYIALSETFVWFVVIRPWRGTRGEQKPHGQRFALYYRFALPMILSWAIVACDRYWLNHIVGQWDMAYVGVLAGWFQLKPFLLIPAFALGQTLTHHRLRHQAPLYWRSFTSVSPTIALWIGVTAWVTYRTVTHVDTVLYALTPHLEEAVSALHTVLWIDALLIPCIAVIAVSRALLESDQRGYIVTALLAGAVLVARGLLQIMAQQPSMTWLAISFLLHTAITLSIPLHLWNRLTSRPPSLPHVSRIAY